MATRAKFRQTLFEVVSLAVLIALAVLVFNSVSTILPTVMQDELVYRENSRITRNDSFDFPNYFYFRLYSLFDLLGEDFYLGVKASNVVFHTATAVTLLFWRRKQTNVLLRALGALLYFCAPFLAFTSFFMPEPVYAFFVVTTLIVFIKAVESRAALSLFLFVLAGLLLSLAQLSKPHGLFVIIGLASYLTISMFINKEERREIATRAVWFTAAFLFFRLAIGFALAGAQTLDFSASYGGGLGEVSASLDVSKVVALGLGVLVNLVQHSLALSIFLAPILFSYLTHRWKLTEEFKIILIVLVTVAVFISAFESYLTHIIGDNHLERILLRHYEYLIPLLWISFWRIHASLPEKRNEAPFWLAASQFLFALAFLGIALSEGALWNASKYSDSGFTGSLSNPQIRWTLVGVWLIIFVLLTLRKKTETSVIATLVTGVVATSGFIGLQLVSADNSNPLPSDRAGIYVRENFKDVPGAEILVVGTNKALTEASVFQMNKPGIRFRIFAEGTALDPSDAFEEVSVIVQFGEVALVDIGQELILEDGFSISRK